MRQERRASFAHVAHELDDARAASSMAELALATTGLPPAASASTSAADYVQGLADLLRASPAKHKCFVALVCVQVFLTLVERVWLFSLAAPATFPPTAQFREALWLFLVILTTAVYVAYFALSSMLFSNYVEMIMYFTTSLVLLGRLLAEAVDRSDECREQSLVACYVQLCLIGLCVMGAMVLSWSMMQELKVKRHKALGARTETQRVYFLYEVFASVRTLDFQFAIVTLFTGVVFFPSARAGPYATAALVVNVVLFVCELAWNWLGREGIRRERAKLLWCFWALSPLLPIFLLAVAYETSTTGLLLVEAEALPLRITVFVMGVLTLACRLGTLALSVALYRLFGPSYVQLRRIIENDRSIVFLRRRAQFAPQADKAVLNPAGAAGAPAAAAAGSAVADWASSKEQKQPHV